MRSRSASSINSKSPENAAIEKISSLITRFHAVLLPKANGSGVFRDLSEEQQYLLNNIDSDNPVHSILAGCLAIDSCLSSIAQAEQNLTDNILKSLTNLCEVWQKAQNELIESVEAKNLSLVKIEQICKKMQESNRNLLRYCQQLPFSEQNEQLKKQQKIMSQQDITFKISSMKLFEDRSDQQILKSNTNINTNTNTNIKELEQQNKKLQEKLSYTQKKVIELQLKLNKLQDVNKSSPKTYQTQKQRNPRKYSQKYQQQIDIDKTSNWPLFNSPSSCSLMHQKQVQSLKEQIISYERKIFQIQEEFKKDRKKLIYQIRMLEKQLQENDVNQDRQLILLLQELEEEIQNLREERRQDERIIGQVQQKLEGMSISRQSRIIRGIKARQSRLGIRYSNIFNQGQNQMDNSRSPSYKKSRMRDRLYTKVDQVSRSSISMPKMKDYSVSDYQKQKMGWRTDKVRPIRDNYRIGYQEYQEPEVRYSYIVDKNPSTTGRRTSKQDNYNRAETHHRTQRSSNLNKIPLVESKHPRQSIIIKPQQQQLNKNEKNRIKEYEDNHNHNYNHNHNHNHNLKYKYRQERYDVEMQNERKGTVTTWKQMISNNKHQGNQRLKTSRI